MAMRLSGLISGMDTESIVEQLVEAKSTKVTTAKKAQIKLNYKQDAWKALNTKLQALQTKFLGTMRYQSSYSKKTTKVSNESAVSVITSENAVNGVQSLRIEQLAKTGYLTGAQLASGKEGYTALSTMAELGLNLGSDGKGSFSVKTGDTVTDISITDDTTISDVLNQLKEAGLNANFDAKNQRLFVSAKESGEDTDFSITASDSNGAEALSKLGLQTSLASDQASREEYKALSGYYVAGDKASTMQNLRDAGLIQKQVDQEVSSYLEKYKTLKSSLDTATEKATELEGKYSGVTVLSEEEYKAKVADLEEKIKNAADDTAKQEYQKELDTFKEEQSGAKSLAEQRNNIAGLEAQMKNITDHYITVTETDGNYSAEATAELITSVEDNYYAKAEYASSVYSAYVNGTDLASDATKVNGQNAIIYLNDAKFENNTNVFEINGLTFTALNETKAGEAITVTTQNDTDGIYDMIKDFLKQYNEVMNEMTKLYNADSASGYEPLTSEEKAELSDSEVEEWEKKIKDAILRRDDNLGTIASSLRTAMSGGITVDGKTMYLSDFGIETLGFLNAAENEQYAYHIDGDEDDTNTAGNADKLKTMIASDPDTVISFFTQLSQKVYSEMSNLSKSVDGYRSFGSFYDDKKMKSDYTDYNSKIAELEEKLNDYEDKWYSKFSAMETALAKLQSSSSAVTGLLGG